MLSDILFRGIIIFIERWNTPTPSNSSKSTLTDLTHTNQHKSVAGCFIIRDWTEKLIKTGAAQRGDSTILVAEARALRDGIQAVMKQV